MNDFLEKEYKYTADHIKLIDFTNLMETVGYKTKKECSSPDIYYLKDNDPDEFQRFRNSYDNPELTKKRKVKNTNNWERIESDLPLDPKRITEKKVKFHMEMDGYKENFRIFKHCFIYWTEYTNYVYYIVYDKEMKESGRFIEVEINKDKVEELKEEASKTLKLAEINLASLGITPQHRLKKSLLEMYRI